MHEICKTSDARLWNYQPNDRDGMVGVVRVNWKEGSGYSITQSRSSVVLVK